MKKTDVVDKLKDIGSKVVGKISPSPPDAENIEESPIETKEGLEEKIFDVQYSEEEIMSLVQALEESENLQLFVKVDKGRRELEEHQKLISLLNKK